MSRPRPNYAIPKRMIKAFGYGFPKKNTYTFSTGVTLKWSRTSWKRLEKDLMCVQWRQVFVAMYLKDELIGASNFMESRNSLDESICCEDYYYDCDARSQEFMFHSEAVIQVLNENSDDGLIQRKEAFAEISSLWISPLAKSKWLWVLPLQYLIHKLYEQDENYSVVILKPFPLEYIGKDPELPSLENDRFFQLQDRRVNALKRIYHKHLWFEVIPENESWMYRNV